MVLCTDLNHSSISIKELGSSNPNNQQLSDSEQEASAYTGNDGFGDSSVDTSGI